MIASLLFCIFFEFIMIMILASLTMHYECKYKEMEVKYITEKLDRKRYQNELSKRMKPGRLVKT